MRYRGCLSIQRRSSRTLRMLARNITSNASPASGTIPTTPSSATLPSIRAVTCQGAPSARLAHQPQRDRGRDEIADHRDQADDAVDAVADLGAGQDEGDVQKLRDGVEPRQPLLAGKVAERIGATEIEAKAIRAEVFRAEVLELGSERGLGNFAPVLIDDRTARMRPAKMGAGVFPGSRGLGDENLFICHHMGNARCGRKLRHAVAVKGRSPPTASARSGGGSSG